MNNTIINTQIDKEFNEEYSQNEKYEGVFIAKKKNGDTYYRSSITFRGKHISLGSYEKQELAHTAYLEANEVISNPSLGIMDYHHKIHSITFDKWVILVNFRDNNIYLGKPIYIKQKMFEYHLSQKCTLKFDMDDLFYYSSHKIMKRGNHLFVSDYGMQINLVSRYGIKNYAVENKDYRFRNGDNTDFRRENIEIWNSYAGVSLLEKNGRYSYQAKIHINGNFIIGVYDTEAKAAIAYNKAIDILKKNGISKKYEQNYVEGISAREYADIYTEIEISDKIKKYKPSGK